MGETGASYVKRVVLGPGCARPRPRARWSRKVFAQMYRADQQRELRSRGCGLCGVLIVAALLAPAACGGDDGDRDFEVALAKDSPWPKFRRDARQTGISPIVPVSGGSMWEFETGKGIFSTPVIGGDGTIYVGSADRVFYAINADGSERWTHETDEIIDSSALLDDEGRVIFGSGDGHLRALDAQSGDLLWSFQADDPEERDAFIRWFEGNVAIGANGDLFVPNDNFYVYSIDRQTGDVKWRFEMPDQTWSLPAVDPGNERIYIGNNNMVPVMGDNFYAIDNEGHEVWSQSVLGTIAASPLLTLDGKIIVGGFDGYVRAYEEDFGVELWSFGARDHIYASPAEHPNGYIVQAAADGTVYGLDPDTGEQVWAFDASEPIRSSPAIDGDGNIYFGSGEGRLFCLDDQGNLRWAIKLIDEDRNDLNSSPALGTDAIYLAGENGSIFSVPYDYCLEQSDDRCIVGPGEALPDDGVMLLYTTAFGGPLADPPAAIDPNQPLAFLLYVRESGDTDLALIDSGAVTVTVDPPVDVEVTVSGDRKFLTVAPLTPFVGNADNKVSVHVQGDYLEDFEREGLRFLGGTVAGSFDETFEFELSAAGPADLPLPVPAASGDPAGVWEFYRLAAPLPTILPSYNQIGFDSLHYLVSIVDQDVAWVIGALPVEGVDRAEPDSATGVAFPMEIDYENGNLTLTNQAGFELEVMGAALELSSFRIAAHLDESGGAVGPARVVAGAICDEIPTYGSFVRDLGFCNPQTDVLNVFGGSLFRPHGTGSVDAPTGLGTVTFTYEDNIATAWLEGATIKPGEHVLSVLLVDDETGKPLARDYAGRTYVATDGSGNIDEVAMSAGSEGVPDTLRAYLMVDTYPAARATLDTTAR